jgi:hypothetical protein
MCIGSLPPPKRDERNTNSRSGFDLVATVMTTRIPKYQFLAQLDSARRRNQKLRRSLFAIHWAVQIPVLCDCSRAMHEVHGRAILTVESSGQKPAYYLTFFPDASPMLTQTPLADTLGKQKPYTSDENALLVRLKEREGMPWAEIAAHFPERSAPSLQVHYSTKLRHKATTRTERLRRRR